MRGGDSDSASCGLENDSIVRLTAKITSYNVGVLTEIDVHTSITDKNGLYVICVFDFEGEKRA